MANWHEERELQRAKEEQRLEAEAKALAQQKYREEMAANQKERENEEEAVRGPPARAKRIAKGVPSQTDGEHLEGAAGSDREEAEGGGAPGEGQEGEAAQERGQRKKAEEAARALDANKKMLVQKRREYEEKQQLNASRKLERDQG